MNEGGDPNVVATLTVPFTELKDDSGFDEREWPLLDFPSGRATGATLALKVLRYQNVPKMAPGAAAPCAAPVVAGDKQRLLDSMQGIKVMIKEAKQVLSI